MFQDTKESAHTTESSPTYGIRDKEVRTSLLVGAILMSLTVGGMLLLANTAIAEALGTLYQLSAFIGIIVTGAFLTAGRYLGLYGVANNSTFLGGLGSVILVFTYSVFGGTILSYYAPETYFLAIAITSVITVILSLIAGMYVYTSNREFRNWDRLSSYFFIGGILMAIPGQFIPSLLVITFLLIFIGFLFDLVFEIWMVSDNNRHPVANGIALYVAFAGVFVHVLQIVLRLLADR